MSVSLRDFIKAIFALYVVTIVIVFGDLFQNGFTVRHLDAVKIGFFVFMTIAIALFIWLARE
jgi:uncharacterized protein with PQ loop repeat